MVPEDKGPVGDAEFVMDVEWEGLAVVDPDKDGDVEEVAQPDAEREVAAEFEAEGEGEILRSPVIDTEKLGVPVLMELVEGEAVEEDDFVLVELDEREAVEEGDGMGDLDAEGDLRAVRVAGRPLALPKLGDLEGKGEGESVALPKLGLKVKKDGDGEAVGVEETHARRDTVLEVESLGDTL